MKPRNNQFALTIEDYIGHTWIVGATNAGKTNTLLYMLRHLLEPENQKKFPTAVVLIDPHGYASMELARMVRPLGKVIILDPTYVAFAINPLVLPKENADRVEIVKDRVGFLSSIITDVLNTDPTNAPRLMWIFKGALYFLYSFGDNPTFRDLYFFTSEMYAEGRENRDRLRARLKNRGIPDEIVQKTIEAIAELEQNAFAPIMNRISNFVLPGNSMTARTFCSRETTIDWSEIRKPGVVTIFRLPRALILDEDFRKLIMSLIIMNLFTEVLKQAREFERTGRPVSEMTNIVLAMDEFQWVSKLSTIDTILCEARKFKLFLYMAHQTLSSIDKDLLNTMSGNVGMIVAHRMGPDDARYVGKLLEPNRAEAVAKEIAGISGHDTRLRKNPIYSKGVRSLARTFPKVDEEYPFAYTEEQVKQYMRGIMQSRFGGAHEAKDVIYQTIGENTNQEGLPQFEPISWYVMLLPQSDPIGYSEIEEKRLASRFYRENGWSYSMVHNACKDLVRDGYFTLRTEYYDYVFKGRDDENVPIGLKARPENMDDLERSRTTVYTPTEKYKNFFLNFFHVMSGRAGGSVHLRVMEKLVEKYWGEQAWCMVDAGKEYRKSPDIVVMYPNTMRVAINPPGKSKVTNAAGDKKAELTSNIKDPYAWDYDTAISIEVEVNPSKDPDHVFHNYLKNQGHNPVRFVVTMQEHVEVVESILTKQHDINPSKYTVECMTIESLNAPLVGKPAQPSVESIPNSPASEQPEVKKSEDTTEKPAPASEISTATIESPTSTAESFQMRMGESAEHPTTQPPSSTYEQAPLPENPLSIIAEPLLAAVEQNSGTPVMSKQAPQQIDSPENSTTDPKSQIVVEVRAEPPVVTTVETRSSQLTTDADSSTEYPPLADPRGKRRRKKGIASSQTKTKDESKLDSVKTILLYLHREGYPGREKLAEVLGVSAKTIDRYLEEMETNGMVEKTGRSNFTLSELASKAVVESEKRKKLQA